MILSYVTSIIVISAIILNANVNAYYPPQSSGTAANWDYKYPIPRGGHVLRHPTFGKVYRKKSTSTQKPDTFENSLQFGSLRSGDDNYEGGIEIVGPPGAQTKSVDNNQNSGLIVVVDELGKTQKPFKLMTATTQKPTTPIRKVTQNGFTHQFPPMEPSNQNKPYDGGIIEIYPDGHTQVIKNEPEIQQVTPSYQRPSGGNNYNTAPKQNVPPQQPVYPNQQTQIVYEPLDTNKYEPINSNQNKNQQQKVMIVPYPGQNGNYQQIDASYQKQNTPTPQPKQKVKHNASQKKKQNVANNADNDVGLLDLLGVNLG